MGRKYSIEGQQNVANPTDTVLGLTGATTIRPEIFFMTLGSSAAPGDVALRWLVQRYTAVGAGTAVTPRRFNLGDPVSLASALHDHTTEPTYTAGLILLSVALNQRGTYPWYATERGGFLIPATANNGIGIQPVHASSTILVDATIHFEE